MKSNYSVLMSALAGYSANGQAAVKRTADSAQGQDRANKEARIAKETCKEICQKAPIPKTLAKALDKLVQSAKDKGVALTMTNLKIVSEGKLEAHFSAKVIEAIAAGAEATVQKDKKQTVKDIVSGNQYWAFQETSGIRLRSTAVFEPLKNKKSIPKDFLKRSGIRISDAGRGDLAASYKKIEKAVISWFARNTGEAVKKFPDMAEKAAIFLDTRNPDAAKIMRNWLGLTIAPETFVAANKIASAESALRDLSKDALAISSAIDAGNTSWGSLKKYHRNLRRFDRWFNVAENFTKDSARGEFVEVAAETSENLKKLSSRALALVSLSKKEADFPHYTMKGIKHIATTTGIRDKATKKGAHRTEAFIRYLDGNKAVVFQLRGERIVVLDVGLTQYSDGLLIHEWIHRINRIQNTPIKGKNEIGEVEKPAHASRIFLDVSGNERLNFRAAYLNSSSWFSYIEKADENVVLRPDVEELIKKRRESVREEELDKYIEYTREPKLFGRQ